MSGFFAETMIRLLKLPPEPPAPFGEEQSLRIFRAAPGFLTYRLIAWGIGQIFGLGVAAVTLVGILIALSQIGEPIVRLLLMVGLVLVIVFTLGASLISFLLLRLDYELRWYKVTDRSLRIREGIWTVREMTMTFANIQNIEISQGPVQRWLGISDLQVQTAGGGGGAVPEQNGKSEVFNMHLGYFRGVDNAEEILRLMQERLRLQRSAGLGDVDDAVEVPAAAASVAMSGGLLEAARAVLAEAQALRAVAEK